jgi:PhnB protein
MAERSIIDQVDDAVAAIMAEREPDLSAVDPTVVVLAALAKELRGLPQDDFKKHLLEELIRSDAMSSPKPTLDPIPKSHPRFSLYLCFDDASAAIDFYKKAFDAEELMRIAEPGGKIGHAEIKIADVVFMLSDEYPDYGAISPKTLGGTTVKLHLYVPDVDAFTRDAVDRGATLVRPVADQSYGDRAGQITDPFGYTWIIATHKKDVPVEEMQRQMDEFSKQPQAKKGDEKTETKTYIREGFHTVTPYLTVERAPELLEFVKQAFGATEIFRTIGSAGGMHAEAKIGDSMVMIGGGSGFHENPTAIHLYIPDVDAAYQRALDAGGTSLFEPADMPYGERAGAVEDPFGNRWYIATTFGPLKEISEYLHTVTQYFHPIGAQGLIDFLKNAFSAEEVMRHQESEGMILHAKVRLGDSIVELGEARTPSQPMPSTIYLYVEDCDAMYEQALKAGGVSVQPPADQPYGDRNAWVKDPFDNVWYIATHLGG